MPRVHDADQPDSVIAVVQNEECPVCSTVTECYFAVDVDTIEDPPPATHTCPACGTESEVAFAGWTFYNEAG